MEDLSFHHPVRERAGGIRQCAIVGVVASGNLEVLVERVLPDAECVIEIKTAAMGFGEVWSAVIGDFVERYSPGGLKFSINDGGARPDTVSLRLAQAVRLIAGSDR
ncbi:malonate decarboxylase delta subunit [Bradyrhizobium japonicum USDA 38]|uniref:malonate decarboxylase acyl carrier protein n=1 Tax=Bradyrhizobium japonicum TaxID=375 RepID=UPI00040A820F|nr:malonate decarboxylase acyl carrier protein [Bradyrhizobium japonicum]MCS3897500.1 malonate decarboxylase delta subunit [Bradyrhizobium japonicum USDA 38]MCS3950014.1 malonate decarboxylase delta subunit [Bradyrhizobium japonicum]MCW2217392.1 malonate decarboxylase delta subunit [Bradyrhizobium japonicum]MCW2342006.1 malonate decarboxylase delta subunit [Bradyrhizobium japonicum]